MVGRRRSIFNVQDFGVLIGVPMMAAISLTTGERNCTIARKAAPYAGAILSRSSDRIAQRVREIVGNHDLPLTSHEVAQQLVTCEIETAMQVVRCHAPMRWVPEISIEGEMHLKTAGCRRGCHSLG